jgi:RND family efflux transporter MFP subunit
MKSHSLCLLMGWLLTPGLLACERPASTTTERIPAVKTIAVRAETPTTERVLSGMLTVGDETRLSFAIGGTLVEAPLREGDAFPAGREIARIDASAYERALARARSSLEAARSRRAVAEESFRRQTALEQKGISSRARLDRAVAEFDSARAEARVAEVAVADAVEDLRRTKLVATRDGVVTRVMARKSEEVAAGQTIYEVGAPDAMEVSVLVPEQLVPALALGSELSVSLPSLGDARARGEITEIGAVAEAGNAFRIHARVDGLPPGARSGMTASVRLCGSETQHEVFLVPLSALVFESTSTAPTVGERAVVFVLDAEREILRRTEVPVAGIVGNRVLVAEGLEPGDEVVVAGVALLRDGQPARRWQPAE